MKRERNGDRSSLWFGGRWFAGPAGRAKRRFELEPSINGPVPVPCPGFDAATAVFSYLKAGQAAKVARMVDKVVPDVPQVVRRTNAQLVQDIATRADAWAVRKNVAGTPQQIGTAQHVYAKKVLDRYQLMFGDRGLQTEVSVIKGAKVPYGTSGSVRLDVLEGSIRNPTAIYDYKFGASGLSASRINQIRAIGGYSPNVPIIEVRP